MKKVLFFGTPNIAVPALEKLSEMSDIEIIGVGVMPDKKIGRKQVLTPCPVKKRALELGLQVVEIHKKSDVIDMFETNPCDMALVIAFGIIFPKIVLDMPEFGVVNIHFSLLPKYRGASPVQSALLSGDTVSGISFQRMVFEMDEGDILYQKEYDIEGKKTSELFEDFALQSAEVLPEFMTQLFAKKLQRIVQNDKLATYCGKFEKKDGEVFPENQTAQTIYRKYLAFDLFPRIFLATGKGNMKLTEVSLKESETAVPLSCAKNTQLWIEKAQLPGKKEALMRDIQRGNRSSSMTPYLR